MQSGGNAAGAVAATLLGNTPRLGAAIALVLILCAVLTSGICAASRSNHCCRRPACASRVHSSISLFRELSSTLAFIRCWISFLLCSLRVAEALSIDANTATGIGVLLFTIVGARERRSRRNRRTASTSAHRHRRRRDSRSRRRAARGHRITLDPDSHCLCRGRRMGNFSLRRLGVCMPPAAAGYHSHQDGRLESRGHGSSDGRPI